VAYIAPEILLGQKYGHTAGAPFFWKQHDRGVAGIRVNQKCFVGFLLEYIVFIVFGGKQPLGYHDLAELADT